jgi:hypothetical protein
MADRHAAHEMLHRQIAELEVILEQAQQDLNAVRGSERVTQWKARTVPLLIEHVGREAAQRFADRKPGPSFSQDLLEELGDEVDMYRTFLLELIANANR